jgi:acetyltransferase-like isoleucine patch superfamily enzyme/glycosyltransferase involved in cell wall biosynthesis
MPPKHPGNQRIAFFFRQNYIDAYAFLRDAMDMLVERGYEIDLFVGGVPEWTKYKPYGVSILVRPEAFPIFSGNVPRLLVTLRRGGSFYQRIMTRFVLPAANRLFFQPFLRRRHKEKPYQCMIGIDPEGLIAAAPAAKSLGVPYGFWSFLLLFGDEIRSPQKWRLKLAEKRASRGASFVITQDAVRGEALSKENGIPPERLVYLPNAPRGFARRVKSDYLARRLNISPHKKIVLCAGMLGDWTMSAELVKAAASWPEDTILVMQSHTPRDRYWDRQYVEELVRSADPAHVILSFDTVPVEDYAKMLDSADVGLAFYQSPTGMDNTQGRNVKLMGSSSSKLAGYLHAGLPVIVNQAVYGPRELVDKWKCGVSVAKPEEIGAALKTIFENYDACVDGAVQCYANELELQTRFQAVIERIERSQPVTPDESDQTEEEDAVDGRFGRIARDPGAVLMIRLTNMFAAIAAAITTQWSYALARAWGISLGKRVQFKGVPYFHKAPTSLITIGSGCMFNSSPFSNPFGVNHPCIIVTGSPAAEIVIGENSGLTGSSILAVTGIRIGSNVLIGANTKIMDVDGHAMTPGNKIGQGFGASAPICIEDGVWIGANSLVLKGVTIGKNTIVGANSLVNRSLPPNVIAAGSPVKVIRSLEE